MVNHWFSGLFSYMFAKFKYSYWLKVGVFWGILGNFGAKCFSYVSAAETRRPNFLSKKLTEAFYILNKCFFYFEHKSEHKHGMAEIAWASTAKPAKQPAQAIRLSMFSRLFNSGNASLATAKVKLLRLSQFPGDFVRYNK